MNRTKDLLSAVRQLVDAHFSGLRRTVRKNLARLTCAFLYLASSVRFGYGGLHLTSIARVLPEGKKFKSSYKWLSRFLKCKYFDASSLAERLLRVLMGFTLAYLIVRLLGTDPLVEKLRPYFEQERRKRRHGTCKVLSVLSMALQVLSDSRWQQQARKRVNANSRATGAGACGAAACLLALTSRARFSSRDPRSSSPACVGEIVRCAPSSERRVAFAERNHSVCLLSKNASTLLQFVCGRAFIALE